MSKSECNKSYMRHKMAMAMTVSMPKPKTTKISSIFTRKPYICTNYTVAKKASDEDETDGKV